LIIRVVERKPTEIARIESEKVDIAIACAIGNEGEFFPVGRIERTRFGRGVRD
jgi:hypothetical protein